eukprot:2170518-Pyramimonas_sp.AAC.2
MMRWLNKVLMVNSTMSVIGWWAGFLQDTFLMTMINQAKDSVRAPYAPYANDALRESGKDGTGDF